MERYELLKDTLEKCDIIFEGDIISKEKILVEARNFLLDSCVEKKHTASFLLHTGSICYDVVVFCVAILANLLLDENDAVEDMGSLEKGTKVTYKKEMWYFEGLYDGNDKVLKGTYVLQNEKGDGHKYIPERALSELIPYKGQAKGLSGKGIRKNTSKRVEFLREIVGLNQNEIVAVPRTSTVIYLDESKLDYFLDNIEINFEEFDKKYNILDLVTVTYYTRTQEIRKRGNANNNEPAIKVTNSMERARELVVEGDENQVLGFVAMSRSAYHKNALDFEELLNRRRLVYSWLSVRMEYHSWLETQIEEKSICLFACTSQLINKISTHIVENNLKALLLSAEIYLAENRVWNVETVDSKITWREIKRVKNNILFVLNHCMGDNVAIQFCQWSYSMLKLFNNLFVSVADYEEIYGAHDEIFDFYKKEIPLMQTLIREKAEEIWNYLNDIYNYLYFDNEKGKEIKNYLFNKKYTDVLFVLPNAKYEKIFFDYAERNLCFKQFSYRAVTETKLKKHDTKKYDCIIYPALLNFDKVNPLDIISARNVVIFTYDSQVRLYKKMEYDYLNYINKINENNIIKLEVNDLMMYSKDEIEDSTYIEDTAIQESFVEFFIQTEKHYASTIGRNGLYKEGFLEASRYGRFSSGEQIVFTKGFEAYVLDLDGHVIEKKVDDLEVGDKLVFTINDDKTKDIVDELLQDLLKDNQQIKEAYELVQGWKDKLRNYKENNDYTYNQLVKKFKECGCIISAQGLRIYIDTQSHIVGPKEYEKFIYIGRVLGDKTIEDNYIQMGEATSYIRSLRIKILKLIERAVVSDLNGEHVEESQFNGLIEKIRDIAVIKQLEKIEEIESFNIQASRANRPIEN